MLRNLLLPSNFKRIRLQDKTIHKSRFTGIYIDHSRLYFHFTEPRFLNERIKLASDKGIPFHSCLHADKAAPDFNGSFSFRIKIT
jgi:hypothetical protein